MFKVNTIKFRHRALAVLLLLFIVRMADNAYCKPPQYIEPKLLRFWRTTSDLELDVISEQSSTSIGTLKNYERDLIVIAPSLSLGFSGSLYHPNLISFDLNVDLGFYWENGEIGVPSGSNLSGKRSGSTYANGYGASVAVLSAKPVKIRLKATRGTVQRDYDFFRRVTVETENYGLNVSYVNDLIPVFFTAQHNNEFIDDAFEPREWSYWLYTIDARNERRNRDRSTLRYTLNDYTKNDFSHLKSEGTRHELTMNDRSTFGSRDSTLRSDLKVSDNRRESDSSGIKNLVLRESIGFTHDYGFASGYSYSLGASESDGTSAISHGLKGNLKHKLYKSLFSSLSLSAIRNDVDGTYGWGYRRYTANVSESYRKKIGESCLLTLSAGGGFQQGVYEGTGSGVNIINERISLSDGSPAFLENAGAEISSVELRDPAGIVTYQQGRDYRLVQRGDVVEVVRVAGGDIPEGSVVVANYDAAAAGSENYTSTRNAYTFRFAMFNGLLNVHGSHNSYNPSTINTRIVDATTENAFGADLSSRFLQAGVEFYNKDSTLLSYSTMRSYQHLNWYLDNYDVTLSIVMDQSRTEYESFGTDRTIQSYKLRADLGLSRFARLNMEGGYRSEEGDDLDKNLWIASARLKYGVGRLRGYMGAEIQDDAVGDESRTRQRIYIYAKRTF